MSRAAFGAVLLAASSALSLSPDDGPAPPNCTAWVVNGYWVGMTTEQAETLRPTKTASKQMQKAVAKSGTKVTLREVELPDGKTGTLFFDADGRVLAWTREVAPAAFDQLDAELSERLGRPEISEQGRRIWVNRECDAQLFLQGYGPVGMVGIQRYSTYRAGAATVLD